VEKIRRINLRVNEQQQYEIIKELVDHKGNKKRAALTLGCSKRTVDRYIAGYKAEGKEYFVHGNRGKKPAHAFDVKLKEDIIDLYTTKYYDANFEHFNDLLEREENIIVSDSMVRNLLINADLLSPLANRKTRREFVRRLKESLNETKSKKEIKIIQTKIVEAEDAHPRRPRCANFGEMIQMDATLHIWFGSKKCTLHLAIDDATGTVVGAWFDEQETLFGYYNVFKQILTNYGIPYMFYTDRRTVFEYRKSGSTEVAKDSFTQFSYACKQLGVAIETTSIPQAKGRIERLIQTMQSRLPVELRLKGVTAMEQANDFLPDFIAHYNARFALPSNSIASVFEKQPSKKKIDMTLAVISGRVVDAGHSIRYNKRFYRTLNRQGRIDYLHPNVKGLVIKTLSGELFFSVDNHVFALEEIPEHERTSKNLNFKPPKDKPRKKYIPPANHPWRLAAFEAFVKKQKSTA